MLAWHLDILELLACNESSLERVETIEETDFVLRKYDCFTLVIAKSDVLEGFVVVEERRAHSVNAPFFTIDY